MTSGGSSRDMDYHSATLPRGTLARSLFDNRLVRLSDRGGASQLIGAAWSDIAARVLDAWVGNGAPGGLPGIDGGHITAVHRLDTIPGVASRASKVGLKNPDFLVFADLDDGPVALGVDAKFSVETARPAQVSAEATAQLFEGDERLTGILPNPEPGASYIDGFFVSPDYSLTHAMFRHKIGHRRLTVSPSDVVLARASARDMFAAVAQPELIELLCHVDRLPFSVWNSLLASQYYFRLERAIVGIVADEQKPLLGSTTIEATGTELIDWTRVRTNEAAGAWGMVAAWDDEVERLRRQRQAIHQVVGAPLSNAEIRDLSDAIMDEMGLVHRPSRNQVRKSVGGRFAAEVLADVGVIMPSVSDFSGELARVADAARRIGAHYTTNSREIVESVVRELVDGAASR